MHFERMVEFGDAFISRSYASKSSRQVILGRSCHSIYVDAIAMHSNPPSDCKVAISLG